MQRFSAAQLRRRILLKFMVMQVDFMIITCLAMLTSVFLTYKTANRLGLPLRIKPLLFCALCALLINFTLPFFSSYLADYHLVLLSAFIVCAAFLSSRYNENLNKAAALTSLAAAEKNRRLPVCLPENRLPDVSFIKNTILASRRNKRVIPVKLLYPPALIITPIAEIVKNDMENAKLLKLTAVITKLPSLDSILEYAYEQKRQKAYGNSIFAFKQALERYENDAYAPFIVIEIGNIYKNTGLYDEAIVIYKKAFSLSTVKNSQEFIREFRNNISYLRITKAILLKHNCLRLAFHQIPSAIMQEIESEFGRWRNQKYAS